jgi:hypothetical protein
VWGLAVPVIVLRVEEGSSEMGPVNGRVMLLSGGIEFQRTESRITSLETLVSHRTGSPS